MSRETIVKRPSNAPEKTPTIHQHICQHCSKKFWQASTLRDHVNFFHLGLKKYVCGECGKALETKQRLRWHVANNRKCSRSKNNSTKKRASRATALRADGVSLRVDYWYPKGQNPNLGPDPRCPQVLKPRSHPIINYKLMICDIEVKL